MTGNRAEFPVKTSGGGSSDSSDSSGIIFDIQHYSLHDGPGVRSTVFFKGCPLSCKWCSNPESQCRVPQMMVYPDLCTRCGACVEACPQGALHPDQGIIKHHQEICRMCGQCIRVCRTKARSITGRRADVETICSEVREHWKIFMHSNGGVTCSGGEGMGQPLVFENPLFKAH